MASSQSIDVPGDVDLIGVTLIKDQTYTFDIDDGSGDLVGGDVDLEFDLIDARGRLIETVSDGDPADDGSFTTLDPRFTFSVDVSGTYYVAIHSEGVDYVDEAFRFEGTGGTGDYTFIVSSPEVPERIELSDRSNDRNFGSDDQSVLAMGGDDEVSLGGGDDIAAGAMGRTSSPASEATTSWPASRDRTPWTAETARTP